MLKFITAHRPDILPDISEKLPKFISTRWNSFTDCIELPAMISDGKRDYDEKCSQARYEGKPIPAPPPLPMSNIPEECARYYEGDFCILQDLWLAYVTATVPFVSAH